MTRRRTTTTAVLAVITVLMAALAACEPASAPWTSDVPSGSLDEVSLTGSTLTIRGWAGDRNSDDPVSVVVTIDGRFQIGATVADDARPDVRQQTGRGAHSGFTRTIEGVTDSAILVCAVAINIGPGDHAVLGCRVPSRRPPSTTTPPGSTTTSTTTTSSTTTSTTIALVPPEVTGLSPDVGPVVGGTAVSIVGTHFTGTTAVYFGSTPTEAFTVNSDSSITATAPAGSAGTVDVTVTTADGTSATGSDSQYTYMAPATLTSLGTSMSPEEGGFTVVINGTGLSSAVAVNFGATPASSFVVVSDTQIVATTPAATGVVSLTVTTPYGTSNGLSFTFVPG